MAAFGIQSYSVDATVASFSSDPGWMALARILLLCETPLNKHGS